MNQAMSLPSPLAPACRLLELNPPSLPSMNQAFSTLSSSSCSRDDGDCTNSSHSCRGGMGGDEEGIKYAGVLPSFVLREQEACSKRKVPVQTLGNSLA